MPNHEREQIDRVYAERDNLLRQIEEGLKHSREIIAQIDNVRANCFWHKGANGASGLVGLAF